MKTQINSLVNGNHINGISGTNSKLRNEIATLVISENPDFMKIEIKGFEIELKANYSLSRKSVTYLGSIPVELYKMFFGDFAIPVENSKAFITIQGDMTAIFSTNTKKSAYQKFENKYITIL